MNVCAIKISLLVYLSQNGHLLQEMYRKDHQTKRKYGMQQVRIFGFWNVDIYISFIIHTHEKWLKKSLRYDRKIARYWLNFLHNLWHQELHHTQRDQHVHLSIRRVSILTFMTEIYTYSTVTCIKLRKLQKNLKTVPIIYLTRHIAFRAGQGLTWKKSSKVSKFVYLHIM